MGVRALTSSEVAAKCVRGGQDTSCGSYTLVALGVVQRGYMGDALPRHGVSGKHGRIWLSLRDLKKLLEVIR
jgi:hypothetical protein